jgi:hypothetical protein
MPDQKAEAGFARPLPEALERFVGDPALWIQPADHREFPGDPELGFGLLERWRQARRLVTAPPRGTGAGGFETRIYAHSTVHPLYEPEKAPHAIVDAQNLGIDFSKLTPARTLRFRPRYKTGAGAQYHRYRPGALFGTAAPAGEFASPGGWTGRWLRRPPGFQPGLFSREHFQDIFASYLSRGEGPPPGYDEVVEHPVMFVTREGDETRNIFHTATDFLNALEAALVVGVSRLNLEVVMLDNAAPAAPYDHLWPRIFAPRHGGRRVRDFAGRRVLFRRAIFSAPGYHSLFFAGVRGENPAPHHVGLLDAFAGLVLRVVGTDPRRERPRGGPLRATLVLRRPYPGHKHMARRLANEAACLAALRSAGLDAQGIDFARRPVEDQIGIAAETDLLVGVHGAGLTHLLWMPPHGGLLEIDPAGGGAWRCFRHLATWTGREVAVINEQERRISGGTEVTIDPARLEAAARDLAGRVRARLAGPLQEAAR